MRRRYRREADPALGCPDATEIIITAETVV